MKKLSILASIIFAAMAGTLLITADAQAFINGDLLHSNLPVNQTLEYREVR